MVNPKSSGTSGGDGAEIVRLAERRMNREDLERAERELFEAWQDGLRRKGDSNPFVRDGAMPKYADAKRKIHFVLKEVSSDFSHESSDGIADLRRMPSWSRCNGRWRRTWYQIIAWTLALNPALRSDGDITSPETGSA